MENLPKNLEGKTRISNLQKSIAVAFQRTNTTPIDVLPMISDIETEFPKVTTETIQKAIRNGGLGIYGKTYGELSTQEICIWIRKETKGQRPSYL